MASKICIISLSFARQAFIAYKREFLTDIELVFCAFVERKKRHPRKKKENEKRMREALCRKQDPTLIRQLTLHSPSISSINLEPI